MLIWFSGTAKSRSSPSQSLHPGHPGGTGGRAPRSQSQPAPQLGTLGAHAEHSEAGRWVKYTTGEQFGESSEAISWVTGVSCVHLMMMFLSFRIHFPTNIGGGCWKLGCRSLTAHTLPCHTNAYTLCIRHSCTVKKNWLRFLGSHNHQLCTFTCPHGWLVSQLVF